MSAADVATIKAGLSCGKGGCTCRGNGNTHCPSHNDPNPSLSVKVGDKVPVIVTCFATCTSEAVIDALKELGLWPEQVKATVSPRRNGQKAEKRWPAHNAHSGEYVSDHVRHDPPDGKKQIRWEPKLPEGVGTRDLELYGVREIEPDAVVFTEGEKAADALKARGIVAVGTVTGAAATPCDDALRPLLGHTVLLWPDNDGAEEKFAGQKHMRRIAERLRSLGHDDVRLVEWLDAPPKGDAADFTGTDEELQALIAAAVPYPFAAGDARPIAETLDAVRSMLLEYVSLAPAQADACTLWVAHSHAFEAAAATPYLAISSAEKRSGKTRLLEVMAELVARPWLTGRTSAAALIRKIDKSAPTLLLDESDAAFSGDKEYAEVLRGVLNTGHRRGGCASVCIGQGAGIDVKDFNTFCPKAIAGIGKLPDTVIDRAIKILMRRRAPGEVVARFRHKNVRLIAGPLHDALETWAAGAVVDLADAEPTIPDVLDDRAADGWEPLLAIADLVGGDWPKRARAAALSLSVGEQRDDDSIGVRLLADIRSTFKTTDVDRLSSAVLAAQLAAIEDAPWGAWGKREKPLDARVLARLLARYEIKPKQIRIGEGTLKGYLLDAFTDAFARYLPSERNTETPDSEQAEPEPKPEPKPDRNVSDDVSANVSDVGNQFDSDSASEQGECFGVSDESRDTPAALRFGKAAANSPALEAYAAIEPKAADDEHCAQCDAPVWKRTDGGTPFCERHFAEAPATCSQCSGTVSIRDADDETPYCVKHAHLRHRKGA